MNIKYSSPVKLRWRGLSCSCNASSDLTNKKIFYGVHVTAVQTLTDHPPMGDRNMYDNSGLFYQSRCGMLMVFFNVNKRYCTLGLYQRTGTY